MLVLEASVVLYGLHAPSPSIQSGVRCSLQIAGNNHICQIETLDGIDIPVDLETRVIITTISGEISLLSFANLANFTLWKGQEIGTGQSLALKEVYLEKKHLEAIPDTALLEQLIVSAESTPNALVYEDVYELLNMRKNVSREC